MNLKDELYFRDGMVYDQDGQTIAIMDKDDIRGHLLATAPELLAVCKQTWHYIHSRQRPGDDGERDNPSYTINIIEKCLSEAISKAEGGA